MTGLPDAGVYPSLTSYKQQLKHPKDAVGLSPTSKAIISAVADDMDPQNEEDEIAPCGWKHIVTRLAILKNQIDHVYLTDEDLDFLGTKLSKLNLEDDNGARFFQPMPRAEYQKIEKQYPDFECRFDYTDSPFHMGMHMASVIVDESLFCGQKMVLSEYSKWRKARPSKYVLEYAHHEFQAPGSTVFYEWRSVKQFGLKPEVWNRLPYCPHQFVVTSHGLHATEVTEGKLTRSEALPLVNYIGPLMA
ncbi:hypothetical protein EMCG_06039 [[Emmonsia] crescens]|uniref:Uncharacterized protein n=1 Tax=[Emmonsia] crescens TaxID=73230 RepID=A0A0G2ICH3_9EURO|nr:hypothetical protein EMCG_06039 [Emmonsia crescens UAMH 3008]